MWGRFAAGALLGIPLAAALTGLIAWGWPGPWQDILVPSLQLFFPLWTAIACAAVLFADTRSAWLRMLSLNIAAAGLLTLVRLGGAL